MNDSLGNHNFSLRLERSTLRFQKPRAMAANK